MAKKAVAKKKQQNFIQRYLRETMGELKKVSWPTRREATNLTIIVLAVLTLMAIFLGSLDVLFGWLLGLVLGA